MLPCLFYAMLGNQTQDCVDGSGQSITELHPQLLLPPLPPPFGAKIKSRHYIQGRCSTPELTSNPSRLFHRRQLRLRGLVSLSQSHLVHRRLNLDLQVNVFNKNTITSNQYLMLTEPCDQGRLLRTLEWCRSDPFCSLPFSQGDSDLLPWPQRASICSGLLLAVEYLHSLDIIHSNVKR